MDLFERWFLISPDGGDGTFEAAYLVTTVGVVSAFLLRRHFWAALRSGAGAFRNRAAILGWPEVISRQPGRQAGMIHQLARQERLR